MEKVVQEEQAEQVKEQDLAKEVQASEEAKVEWETSSEWENQMYKSMALIRRSRPSLSMLLVWKVQSKKSKSLLIS